MKVHYIRNGHTPFQCLVQSVSKINYTGGEGEAGGRRRKGMEREKNRRVRGELEGRRERGLAYKAWLGHPIPPTITLPHEYIITS